MPLSYPQSYILHYNINNDDDDQDDGNDDDVNDEEKDDDDDDDDDYYYYQMRFPVSQQQHSSKTKHCALINMVKYNMVKYCVCHGVAKSQFVNLVTG